jgi:DNA-binding MarR family transcriptional regulator
MLLLGLGMGLVMQVLVIAVQNAVDYRDLGVATSGNSLFRSIGGSVGTAVLGAIFAARLAAELSGAGDGLPNAGAGLSLEAMSQMTPAARAVYAGAFTRAIDLVFNVATVVGVVGFLVTWLLPERPLRETVSAKSADVGQEVGGAMAMPAAPDSYEELVRGLSAVVDRNVRRHHVERIAERARVGVSAEGVWLLMRVDERPGATLEQLARRAPYDETALRQAADELRSAALVTEPVEGDMHDWSLTTAGCEMVARIVAARRAHLEEVFGQWTAEERQELATLLKRVTHELIPDGRTTGEHAVVPSRDA